MRLIIALLLLASTAIAQTPNMGITKATPGVTAGPLWAQQLNDAIDTLDAHDHSSGKGKKVTPSGLDITGDLEFNGNDAKELRTTAFESQGGTLSVADTGALYNVGGNLYWNNGSGAAVQVTSGSAVNNSVTGAFATSTPGAYPYTVVAGDAQKVLLVDTSSARTINLPAATTAVLFAIKDKTGSAASNPISVVRSGGDTIDGSGSTATLDAAYGWWFFVSDGVSNWTIAQSIGAGSTLTARSRLGLTIGTHVQAYDEELADVAGLTPTDNNFIVGNGTAFVAESGATARTSLGAAASGSNSDITALTAVSTSNFSPTYSGGAATFDAAPTTQSATYTRLGKMLLYYNRFTFEIAPGSSDTASFTATLPLTASTAQDGSCWGSYDIATVGAGPAAAVLNSTTQVSILREASANWTKDKATTVWIGCLYTVP
jgi:hypothetical protein